MTTLLVDPARLHAAAREQSEVGRVVSGLASGARVAANGVDLAGLDSGSACQAIGAALAAATTDAHQRLTDHASKLSTAAEHYQRTDEEFSRRLRSFASRP